MPQITNGRVIYSRKIQPAEYESEGVEAELFFIVGEDETPESAMTVVGELVRRKALELLGQQRAAPRPPAGEEPSHPAEGHQRRRSFRHREHDEEDPPF